MTIQATSNRVSYDGTGSLTPLAIPFPFFAQTDLVIIETIIATGVQTTKVLTTDYTVTGTLDGLGHFSNGGTVTPVLAFPVTVRWSIYRDPPQVQALDLVNNDPLPAESVEAAIDYQTMLIQRIADLVVRGLRQPDGDVASVAILPSSLARASMFLAFDGNGDPIAAAGTSGDLTPVSSFINTLLDDVDAASARTTLGAMASVNGVATTGTVAADPTAALGIANKKYIDNHLNMIQDFRLSLTTGLPVTTADVTGAGTLYAVPYNGNRIALYDGTNWVVLSAAQFSLALVVTAGKPYDVFVYNNAGVPTLETLVWTNDTTRATALVSQDGVWVKSGAVTRRYVGTIYASGTNTTEDSAAKRYVWNYNHRVRRAMAAAPETTNSWTYTTATWRQANANAANQLDAVIGIAEDAVEVQAVSSVGNSTNAVIALGTGVGLDSTSVNSAQVSAGAQVGSAGSTGAVIGRYVGVPGAGRHTFVWLEISQATGTTTWYGDNGTSYVQAGITGVLNA